MIQKKALISAFCYALEKTKKNSWTKIPEFMDNNKKRAKGFAIIHDIGRD